MPVVDGRATALPVLGTSLVTLSPLKILIALAIPTGYLSALNVEDCVPRPSAVVRPASDPSASEMGLVVDSKLKSVNANDISALRY